MEEHEGNVRMGNRNYLFSSILRAVTVVKSEMCFSTPSVVKTPIKKLLSNETIDSRYPIPRHRNAAIDVLQGIL